MKPTAAKSEQAAKRIATPKSTRVYFGTSPLTSETLANPHHTNSYREKIVGKYVS